MAYTQTNINETVNTATGERTTEEVVVDVTAEVVELDLHAKARAALAANATFLALAAPTNAQTLAQVKTLTRECSALIRLLIRGDLLADTTGT
jgi:hypothetical protein